MKRIIVILMLVCLAGCSGLRERSNIREGMLTKGLSQESFLKVWGKPDKTGTRTGAEIMQAGFSGNSGGAFKGKASYEMWVYKHKETDLYFYKRRLIDWQTEKTVKELESK